LKNWGRERIPKENTPGSLTFLWTFISFLKGVDQSDAGHQLISCGYLKISSIFFCILGVPNGSPGLLMKSLIYISSIPMCSKGSQAGCGTGIVSGTFVYIPSITICSI